MEDLKIQDKKLFIINESEIYNINEYIKAFKIKRENINRGTIDFLINVYTNHESIIVSFYDKIFNKKYSEAYIRLNNENDFIIELTDV